MQLASLRSFSFKVQELNLHGKSQVESPHCLQSSNRLITSVSMVHMLLKHSHVPFKQGHVHHNITQSLINGPDARGLGKESPVLLPNLFHSGGRLIGTTNASLAKRHPNPTADSTGY